MRKSISLLLFVFIVLTSCNNNNNEKANQYLEDIYSISERGNYEEALKKIDSIQILFPKSYNEIKKGIAYKQVVRKALNEKQITNCDSLIAIYEHQIDSLKDFFVVKQDKQYQDKGTFIPKAINSNTLGSTMLRSGVDEDGIMYLESVYLGNQLHNIIKITSKDKEYVESLPITDDGLNFRFSNLGKQYEVIRVTPIHDNGLVNFIYLSDQLLTVTLKGKHSTTFTLPDVQKKAIKETYLLSQLILRQDSIAMIKGKAETLINYLDSKETKKENEQKSVE